MITEERISSFWDYPWWLMVVLESEGVKQVLEANLFIAEIIDEREKIINLFYH